uniref:Uncharacterized protein n=1 Tax=Rhizophora mucronata TaxID=61149 RepID=A0A2P2K257_RHIMU
MRCYSRSLSFPVLHHLIFLPSFYVKISFQKILLYYKYILSKFHWLLKWVCYNWPKNATCFIIISFSNLWIC